MLSLATALGGDHAGVVIDLSSGNSFPCEPRKDWVVRGKTGTVKTQWQGRRNSKARGPQGLKVINCQDHRGRSLDALPFHAVSQFDEEVAIKQPVEPDAFGACEGVVHVQHHIGGTDLWGAEEGVDEAAD